MSEEEAATQAHSLSWFLFLDSFVGWLVFYVNTVTTNASTVLSTPLTVFGLTSAAMFTLLLLVVWKHNHSNYERRYTQWDRSFVCEHCGALSEIGLDNYGRGVSNQGWTEQ